MNIIDDQDALGADQLDARGVAERRVVVRQRVTLAQIEDRTIGQRDNRPDQVGLAVA
jgi:hypothetical protein